MFFENVVTAVTFGFFRIRSTSGVGRIGALFAFKELVRLMTSELSDFSFMTS